MDTIKLVLVDGSGKVMHVRNADKDYHCQFGMVKKEDLKKIKESGMVKTNTGTELAAFKPGFADIYRKIRRLPQIIPLKDLGAIITETGLGKSSVVVDAGAGSGALAIFLGNIAKKVVTYEIRDDFAAVVEENIKLLQLKNVAVKRKDVYAGIEEKNVDVITLDLPEPWKAVETAAKALKIGGFMVSYSPTTPQVSDFIAAAGKIKGLLHIKTIEVIQREWEFNERIIRPKSQPIGHSGFITVVRKVSNSSGIAIP